MVACDTGPCRAPETRRQTPARRPDDAQALSSHRCSIETGDGMVQVTYPGVYIQEKSSGVHTITGVATSIAAFVGYTRKGTVDKAVAITSYADFERSHGGLTRDSPVSYAVRQFFLNGSTQAYIVRVASGYATATWTLNDAGGTVLTASASSPGAWGNDLRLSVDITNVRNK